MRISNVARSENEIHDYYNSGKAHYAWDDWTGPYTNSAGENMTSTSKRYVKWKAVLSSIDGLNTPILHDVTVTWYSWLESSIYDTGTTVSWENITWDAYLPTGTSLRVYTRSGNDDNPYDGGWSSWQFCENNQPVPSPNNRYLQYRVDLLATTAATPEFYEICIKDS